MAGWVPGCGRMLGSSRLLNISALVPTPCTGMASAAHSGRYSLVSSPELHIDRLPLGNPISDDAW
jgi:hypothetical protein